MLARMASLAQASTPTSLPLPLPEPQACNHLCFSVDSVPFHKVFSGFGSRAMLKYSGAIQVGALSWWAGLAMWRAAVLVILSPATPAPGLTSTHVWCSQVLDAGTKQWVSLQAAGDAPCGREDTAWAFDARTTSLVLFGGWSNRWMGDTWRLDVSSIVGPGYACLGISPSIGPVAGGTEVTISGLRFRWGVGTGVGATKLLPACRAHACSQACCPTMLAPATCPTHTGMARCACA